MIADAGNRMIVIRRWHLFVLLVLIAAAALRFPLAGDKPMHHDESIHAFYSYKLAHGGDYRYDPVYHGPFMYYANALSFFLFGESEAAARFMPGILGTGAVALILMLAPWIGRVAAGAAALLAAFSPTLVHVSRFAREDSFFAFFCLAVVVFFLRYERSGRSGDLIVAGASLGLAFSVKESSYLFSFLIVAFLFIRHARRILSFWRQRLLVPALGGILLLAGLAGTLVTRSPAAVVAAFGVVALVLAVAPLAAGLARPRDAIRASLAFFAVWIIFFSSFFTNPKGILDGVFAALTYWSGQQAAPRIPGPWWYYLPRFALYEGLLVIGFVFSIPRLLRNGAAGRFLLWWCGSSVVIYAIAQEKVPWLMAHQALPMAICAGVAWGGVLAGERRRGAAIAVAAILGVFTFHNAFGLAFLRGADPREAMVYVQTHSDLTRAITLIEEYDFRHGNDRTTPVTVEGAATWPFAWYLREWPASYPGSADLSNPTPILIAAGEREAEVRDQLGDGYFVHRYRLRAWWLPDLGKDSFGAWTKYALFREPFSPIGSSDFVLCLRNDAASPSAPLSPSGLGRGSFPPRGVPVVDVTAVIPSAIHSPPGLSGPRDLAASGADIFVADTGNDRVLRIDAGGKVTKTIPGFNGATGLAAGAGWLAVADTWNHRVVIHDRDGGRIRVLGPDGGEGRTLFGPRDVARIGDAWYVVDTGNRRVVTYDADGEPSGTWGREGAGPDGFVEPVGIAVAGPSRLLVADTGNHRVRVVDPSGSPVGDWPVPGWTEFYTEPYLAALPDGRVVASDSSTGVLLVYSATGVLEKRLALDPSAGPWQPEGIAAAPDGSLWVADRAGNRIVVLAKETLR